MSLKDLLPLRLQVASCLHDGAGLVFGFFLAPAGDCLCLRLKLAVFWSLLVRWIFGFPFLCKLDFPYPLHSPEKLLATLLIKASKGQQDERDCHPWDGLNLIGDDAMRNVGTTMLKSGPDRPKPFLNLT